MSQQLIIMTGNIGSGKSLIARKYAQRGFVIISMDSIQQLMHGGIYGLYDRSLKLVYHRVEEEMVLESLRAGKSVLVDRTLMYPDARNRFIRMASFLSKGSPPITIMSLNFGQGSFENLENRMKEPRGLSFKKWQDIFHVMFELYQRPSLEEGFDIIQTAPNRFTCYAYDFDGTITMEADGLRIGNPRMATIEQMQRQFRDDSNIIIIWTCREHHAAMKAWLKNNNVPYDFINENPLYKSGRKIFAHKYYDDRATALPEGN